MNTKMSNQIRRFYNKTEYTTPHTLSTTSTTMTRHTVDLLLKPFNFGEHTLPVLRVDDQVFVYDKAGLHKIPDKAFPHTEAWIRLGNAVLRAGSNVVVAAFELYSSQFRSFDAVTANPVKFIRALIDLFNGLNIPAAFRELEERDWQDIEFDCKHILKLSSGTSGASGRTSFNGLRSGY